MAYWTYQVDPTNFLMESMLAVALKNGGEIALQPNDGEGQVAVGDLVYLCEDAELKNPGVLGQAEVLTRPEHIEMPAWQERFWIGKETHRTNRPRVKLRVIRVFEARIPRSALRENPLLRRHPFADYYRGTMRAMDAEQASELDRLAGR